MFANLQLHIFEACLRLLDFLKQQQKPGEAERAAGAVQAARRCRAALMVFRNQLKYVSTTLELLTASK